MSYNNINNVKSNIGYDNVGPYGNSCDSFATLDTAFSPSATMSDFENRVKGQNSLFTNIRCMDDNNYMISPQSEEKINNGVDQMVGAFYNRDRDLVNQLNPQYQTVQDGNEIPLNRSQQYNAQQLGTELLENFDGQTVDQYQQCKPSYWKFVLFVVAILILLYVIYRIIRQNKTKKIVSTTTTTEILNPKTGLEKFNQAFKKTLMCNKY